MGLGRNRRAMRRLVREAQLLASEPRRGREQMDSLLIRPNQGYGVNVFVYLTAGTSYIFLFSKLIYFYIGNRL
jgi:hypothetical protein